MDFGVVVILRVSDKLFASLVTELTPLQRMIGLSAVDGRIVLIKP